MVRVAKTSRILVIVVALAMAITSQASARGLTLRSVAFNNGGTIGHHFTYHGYGCTGDNASPALRWSGAPAATKSFALTVYDPDAPHPGGWWHWVLFDLPASATGLAENAGEDSSTHSLPAHAIQGRTDFGSTSYGGPCPPPGKAHHYIFTLYALDVATVPGASAKTTGPQLDKQMTGHVIAKAKLVGLYGR
jgi:Raf kinase inhibitor-like YbhB/YbcL family protein